MPSVFNTLPGLEVPVGSITTSLDEMWSAGAGLKGEAVLAADDAKAIQVNVVLHLGLHTTPEDALVQFQTVLEFSKRYPCRVVILCPLEGEDGPTELHAKIYGECHLGKTKQDKRCVEFVILSYPRPAWKHLENQASICLSADLPMYYWAHRFRSTQRLAEYHYLLGRAKRLLMDSAVVPEDALGYPWPRPETVRDLTYARLLPARQALGQFLSRYSVIALGDGLKEVVLAHDPAVSAEARVLLAWVRDRLGQCGVPGDYCRLEARPPGGSTSFDLRFTYHGPKFFRWTAELATGHAAFSADFGSGRTDLAGSISLLPPTTALSEAMFF
jgi:hypothetical protein